MSTLAATSLTLLDIAKRLDPDGTASAIAELLSQENEVLMDMPWIEGNLPTGHLTTVRTGLPDAAWRKLNQGVDSSKSTTAQITESCGMLESWSTIDRDLAMLNGNTVQFQASENSAFVESLNEGQASTLFYGDTTLNPERYLGLSPRFDDVPTTSGGAQNKVNVIDGGGTGTDNASIWLIGWSPRTVHGIYPKGSKAGLITENLGEQICYDANNKKYMGLQTHYQWKCGIAVRDWRYIVRICNIDISDLTYNGATGAKLMNLMVRALERIQSLQGVTPVFYAGRTIRSFLRQQQVEKISTSTLTLQDIAGKPVLSFGEVPVRRVDALSEAEARVT